MSNNELLPENYVPTLFAAEVESMDVRWGREIDGHKIGALYESEDFGVFVKTEAGATFYHAMEEQLVARAEAEGYKGYEPSYHDVHSLAFTVQSAQDYAQREGTWNEYKVEAEAGGYLLSDEDFLKKYTPGRFERYYDQATELAADAKETLVGLFNAVASIPDKLDAAAHDLADTSKTAAEGWKIINTNPEASFGENLANGMKEVGEGVAGNSASQRALNTLDM